MKKIVIAAMAAVMVAAVPGVRAEDKAGAEAKKSVTQLQEDFRKLKFGMFIHYNMATGDILEVFKAQMAVGDPARYPELAGNVKSIDTRGFFRSPDRSPGSEYWCYNKNAETFLLIGEAMGRAMLNMLDGGTQAQD